MDSVQYDKRLFENINICRKLRRLGKLERVRLDENEHRSGLNRHLFDYIEYAGMDVLSFVKDYLSNLQPYMIERRADQESQEHCICVIDKIYRVSIYIKVDNTQFEEVIVSFHEDNKRGIAKTNDVYHYSSNRFVPVFADSEDARLPDEDKYGIKVFLQRGLKIFPIEFIAKKYSKDVYIVNERIIEQSFVDYCNTYIQDLYVSDLNIDFDQIEVFSALQQLSFTSYGQDTFSTLSLLIDSFAVQKDVVSKAVADSAIVTFSQNLRLSDAQKQEMIALLETKFSVTSIRGIRTLLSRIEDNLARNYISSAEKEIVDAADTESVAVVHPVRHRHR